MEPPQFMQEEMLILHRSVSNIIEDDNIPIGLVFNLEQTSLSYVSPGKYTFN